MCSSALRKIRNKLRMNDEEVEAEIKCAQFESNRDKVRYVESLILKYGPIFERKSGDADSKNNEKCKSFRVEGNNLHKQGKYAEALVLYNKSVCFAMSNEDITIGYSNRSAALYEMGQFQDCLKNISMARKCGDLPKNLASRLNKREEQCKGRKAGTPIKVSPASSLSYSKHSKVPFIVDRLEVKREHQHSWICAKEYLEEDTLVMIEKPLVFALLPEGYYVHCDYCLVVSATLIPCPNCTSTMFCDENCMKQAHEEYHQWECPVKSIFEDSDSTWLLSFRMLCKMLCTFGDTEGLKKYWKELPKRYIDWFSRDQSNFSQAEYFRVFHSFLYKTKRYELCDVFDAAFIAALLKREVLGPNDLDKVFHTAEQKDLFSEIIYHNILVIANLIGHTIVGGDSLDFNMKYCITRPLITELKTSDRPNIAPRFGHQRLLYYVCRPIKKGEYLEVSEQTRNSFAQGSSLNVDDMLREILLLNLLSGFSGARMPFRRNFPFI